MTRLVAGLDGSSARLIDATEAIRLAGDRVLPRETARDVCALARATRKALTAQEDLLAQGMLEEIKALLPGASERATEVITRRADNVLRYLGGAQ